MVKMPFGMKNILFVILAIVGIVSVSCTSEDDDYGFISLNFIHEVGGNPVSTDTLKYHNEAGNFFSVDEIKYFISNINLIKSDGSVVSLSESQNIHYIDNNLSGTMYFEIPDSVPSGVYKSLSFTFGLNEAVNHTGLFNTPPECYMETPEEFGGGYSYMRMNGRYAISPGVNEKDYDFNLGIGLIHPSTGLVADEITYVHNNFDVTVNDFKFELDDNEEVVINIIMEVENWFCNPHSWDFQSIGGDITDNQDAQIMAKENGQNVFSAFVSGDRSSYQ